MATTLSHTPPIDMLAMKSNSTCSQTPSKDYFAFARIKNDICLVQASAATPVSALTTVDVKIFKHEFISIFRFSEYQTFHPSDICILEPIDEQRTRYEADKETVFLARDVMERLSKLSSPREHNFRMNGMQGYGRKTMFVQRRQHQR